MPLIGKPGHINEPSPAKMEGSIIRARRELAEEVESLQEAFQRLYERLQPALEPQPAPSSGGDTPPEGSQIAQALFLEAGKIRSVRYGINEILDRLAV